MMNHGNYSIVGMNEDAYICETPSLDTEDRCVLEIEKAIERTFDINPITKSQWVAIACIKTDLIGIDRAVARSLNINIFEPIKNHVCALPGKMTESPFLVDSLVKFIYARIPDNGIANRPIDNI